MCFLRRLLASVQWGLMTWYDVTLLAEEGWLCSVGHCYRPPCNPPSVATCLELLQGAPGREVELQRYWVSYIGMHLYAPDGPVPAVAPPLVEVNGRVEVRVASPAPDSSPGSSVVEASVLVSSPCGGSV